MPRKKQDKRAALQEKYQKLGIVVHPNWQDDPKISSIELDFTEKEWYSVLTPKGGNLDSCCAVIGSIRDILVWAIREGNEIRVEELHDAVALWCEHSETDLTIKITKRPKHPIKRLVWFWQQIQADVLLNNVVKPANLTDLPFFGAESPYIVDATPTSERPKGARRGGSPLG